MSLLIEQTHADEERTPQTTAGAPLALTTLHAILDPSTVTSMIRNQG
jgi:hypothetical protein